MFTAYCYSEGDIHFGDKVPNEAIAIMKGREGLIRKIIEDECPIGNFSDEKSPFIEAVNLASKEQSDNQNAQGDALGQWLDTMSDKYSDRGVFFSRMKY